MSVYWVAAAATATSPWMERVTSKANLSDAVSRGDFAEARRLGWRQLFFDLSGFWLCLARLVESGSFEVGPTVATLLGNLAAQRHGMGLG